MLNVSKTILFSTALSFTTFDGSFKNILRPNCLRRAGEDVCRSDYRPLTHAEAQEHKTALISRMNVWDIAGLQNDWVIHVSHHGLIKRDQASLSRHMVLSQPLQTQARLYYQAQAIEEHDNVEVQRALVSDNASFIRPLSYLAHNLVTLGLAVTTDAT